MESCLDPLLGLLFLIYINDINNSCKYNEMSLFAEDTNIFVKNLARSRCTGNINKIAVYIYIQKISDQNLITFSMQMFFGMKKISIS